MKISARFVFAFGLTLFLSAGTFAQQWWNVGSAGFSADQAWYISLAIDGSGTPYVAYLDYGNSHQATVMKYTGSGTSGWENVGSPGFSLAAGQAQFTCIALDRSGTPYVAYQDWSLSSEPATVMKYTGNGDSGWEVVGSADFSAGGASNISIAINGSGTPYVAYTDEANSSKATVMKYTGTGISGWENVGSAGFSAGQANSVHIAIDGSGSPYVAYQDGGNSSKATVMKYDGSNWVAVGSPGFSAGTANPISIAIDGSETPYVAYQDWDKSYEATVMKYTGSGLTGWEYVGSPGFSAGEADYISIAIDRSGTPYVAYEDQGHSDQATVMKYNGTSWETVGTAGFSAGQADNTCIAIAPNGIPVVAYTDYGNGDKATAMKYSLAEDTPLPVQATGFVAKADAGSVTLSWKTQSEVDNAGFNILRQEQGTLNENRGDQGQGTSPEGMASQNWQLIASYTSDKSLCGLGTSPSGKSYSFTDKKVTAGSVCNYKIQSVATDGTTEDLVTLPITVKSISIPKAYALYQNFPNPFNPTTTIQFDLKEQSRVTLEIYNVLGQRVVYRYKGILGAGRYNEVVDMDRFASGVYWYRLKVVGSRDGERLVAIKKAMLVK